MENKENIQEEVKLIDVLVKFTQDVINFERLEIDYYYKYFDLDENEFQFTDFHAKVCEKIDFTAKSVTIEEAKLGWITIDDFKEWLIFELNNLKSKHSQHPML